MSPAVESAAAPVPLDVGALERKLIALRGEIDAILVQLATVNDPAEPVVEAESAAEGAGATCAPAQAEPATSPAHEADRAETEAEASVGEAAHDAGEAERPEPSSDAGPAAEQQDEPTAGLTATLAACQNVAAEEPAMAPDAAEVAARGPEAPTTEDVIPTDTMTITPPAETEPEAKLETTTADALAMPADDAADTADKPAAAGCEIAIAVEAPVAVVIADAPPDAEPELVAAAVEAPVPTAEAPAAPAAAVIAFEPRQRKEKADLAAAKPVAAPRRRRVASRIAAGIVALIAAAGALVMADREALGGPQTLPWTSPLPSYRMPWSLFAPQKRAEGTVQTGVNAATGGMAAGDVLLGSFGEFWPMTP